MTNEEAIRIISAAQGECEWNAPLDYQIAFDMAIEALKKQVPQKVIQQYKSYNGAITCFEEFVCPACGAIFYDDCSETTQYYDFCPNCGQANDWSDDE